MKQNQLWKALGFSVFGVLLLAVPFLVTSSYYMKIISMGAIYLILAAGLNILLGFTGQMSFTQAAFWGIGGYVSAILNTRYHVSFWLALPLSGLFTAGVGFLLGWPSLRKLKKFYLAVTTIGFVQITGIVLTNWTEVTNGADGISGIVRPVIGTLFTKEQFMYYVIMTGVVVLVGFTALLKNSRVGRAMLAIREDDLAAEVIGVDTFKYKVLAFTLSAFYGGIAGSLFAHLIGFISPDTYTFEEAV
ncbi:MAG: branched-chain amino acid ABC transporter permease, partial [Bacteroidota bacterium]